MCYSIQGNDQADSEIRPALKVIKCVVIVFGFIVVVSLFDLLITVRKYSICWNLPLSDYLVTSCCWRCLVPHWRNIHIFNLITGCANSRKKSERWAVVIPVIIILWTTRRQYENMQSEGMQKWMDGVLGHLRAHILNWARRTSWGWWNESDDIGPPDRGCEIRVLAIWSRARYLSVTELSGTQQTQYVDSMLHH